MGSVSDVARNVTSPETVEHQRTLLRNTEEKIICHPEEALRKSVMTRTKIKSNVLKTKMNIIIWTRFALRRQMQYLKSNNGQIDP